jgi:hypothetical protein
MFRRSDKKVFDLKSARRQFLVQVVGGHYLMSDSIRLGLIGDKIAMSQSPQMHCLVGQFADPG